MVERSGADRNTFETFVGRAAGRRAVVACAADAAGMAAGELARRHLVAAGCPEPQIIIPGKGELLTGRRLADRARAAGAEALLALDLGATAEALLPGVAMLFIDSHRHQANLDAPVIEPRRSRAAPAGVTLFRLLRSSGDAEPLRWLAAVAADAGHPKVDPPRPAPGAKTPYGKSALREVSVLLNAAGRSSDPQTDAALALLARADGPVAMLADVSDELARLWEARAEVMREVGHWSRTRPRFMWRVALVPVASPCRIEPVIAAMWERQLGQYMIVAANSGYVPGTVTVVTRTASPARNLLRLLDAVTPEGLDEPIALGRRDYVEAAIPREAWKAMLRKMRFRRVKDLVPPPHEARLF